MQRSSHARTYFCSSELWDKWVFLSHHIVIIIYSSRQQMHNQCLLHSASLEYLPHLLLLWWWVFFYHCYSLSNLIVPWSLISHIYGKWTKKQYVIMRKWEIGVMMFHRRPDSALLHIANSLLKSDSLSRSLLRLLNTMKVHSNFHTTVQVLWLHGIFTGFLKYSELIVILSNIKQI